MELDIKYIVTASVALITLVIGFFYYRSLKRLKQAMGMAAELFFVNQALQESLGINSSEDALDIHKEDFIKFLSDSRDWAFEYIEEVQKGLDSFIKEVEPEIEHYNKYGAALDGMISPHDKALKKISKEFEKLKNLLPEEQNDGR